jgi:hypothetical protein
VAAKDKSRIVGYIGTQMLLAVAQLCVNSHSNHIDDATKYNIVVEFLFFDLHIINEGTQLALFKDISRIQFRFSEGVRSVSSDREAFLHMDKYLRRDLDAILPN